MPSNFLLLLPLLGGYLFNHILHFTRFRAQALTGHRLVFEAAVTGMLFLLLARAIVTIVVTVVGLPPEFVSFWKRATNSTPFAGTTALAVLLAPPAACLINIVVGLVSDKRAYGLAGFPRFWNRWELRLWWRASREYSLDRAIRVSGNALQKLLHRVAVQYPEMTVGLTLESGKIYAGYVSSSPNLAPTDEYISLVPVMSGHRGEDMSIEYDFAYPLQKMLDLARRDGVAVAVPISAVKSAHMLDREYYESELERLTQELEQVAE